MSDSDCIFNLIYIFIAATAGFYMSRSSGKESWKIFFTTIRSTSKCGPILQIDVSVCMPCSGEP